MSIRTVILTLGCLVLVALAGQGTKEDSWLDTAFTTSLWQTISSGTTEDLENLIEINGEEEVANARSGDGRGPLWWAYEYEKPEMVKLLKAAGCSEEERDADGRRPSDIAGAVGPTKNSRRAGSSDSPARDYHGEEFEDDF